MSINHGAEQTWADHHGIVFGPNAATLLSRLFEPFYNRPLEPNRNVEAEFDGVLAKLDGDA